MGDVETGRPRGRSGSRRGAAGGAKRDGRGARAVFEHERHAVTGAVAVGKRVLELEARAIDQVADRLGDEFARAADLLARATGRVIVSGVGKSGLVARKIAATL